MYNAEISQEIEREEIIIIEDQVTQAKKFYAHLKIEDKIPLVKYLKNGDNLDNLFLEKYVKRFYLVDINLGNGRRDEGIELIGIIRKKDSKSMIIVYSGYPDKERECLKAGADLFFEKDANTYEEDIWKIRNLILREQEKEEDLSWEKEIIIYSHILDIDENSNLVQLSCTQESDSNDVFDRFFPLNHFKNCEDLMVGQSVLVTIFERPGEVRFLFEVDMNNEKKCAEYVDISDLEDSSIFKPL
jgi:ActR/RegA family two-component response regulator